ncbi:DUF4297 family anti-phage-associated protein [uncultured Thomasclavelia sp.]|uniref:DUF4297 family anti-phage-associated protein n=1 Tax=uncultured Thomasclavelia sp. TaxID=3025759 RepID=UPI00280C3486|nr:DUF4297 family anti-phage-associated protein [uncultured Thomasclavelia sp.]
MTRSRDAIDTIKGYYYQFDYFILQLLNLKNDDDTVTIEGIEDVDIFDEKGLTAVQCKYYSKTEYNHSVIAKPIRLMLKEFLKKGSSDKNIKYKIYGKYESGHDKFPKNLDVEFAKKYFFTFREKGVDHVLHEELNLSDEDIQKFLDLLSIDICAEDFDVQEEKIIDKLKVIFNCDKFDAEYYYYNNALRFVKEISIKSSVEDRIISKRVFLRKINNKKMLFDAWYLQYKGIAKYCEEIKKQYFSHVNISPYERFFLIECDKTIEDEKIFSLIIKISKNWSKLLKREVTPFCPYVYLHGISEQRLITIKKMLQKNDIRLLDGYDFLGSDFFVKSILEQANYYNGIKIKIINTLTELNFVVMNLQKTKEIYHFYLNEPFYENNQSLCYNIQIPSTEDIIKII